MRKNGFAPIVIIVGVIIVGMIGYFGYKNYRNTALPITSNSSPTPITTDTSSWKIYQSTTPAFSFKYPADFVKKTGVGNKAILSVGNDKYSFLLYTNYMHSFYSSEAVSIRESFDSKDLSVNVRSLGSYTAYIKSEQSAGGDYSFSRTVIVPMQRDMVVFMLSPKDENEFGETENLADQILSTFKFTK